MRFKNQMLAERVSDDPPSHLESLMGDYRNIPDFVQSRMIAVWTADCGQIIAFAEGNILIGMDENQHGLDYQIEGLPEHRQQGIGRALLCAMVAYAQETGRTLLLARTNSTSPAGDIAMANNGGKVGLEMFTNRLDSTELDRGLVQVWLQTSPPRSTGFSLGLWEGPIPEDDLER